MLTRPARPISTPSRRTSQWPKPWTSPVVERALAQQSAQLNSGAAEARRELLLADARVADHTACSSARSSGRGRSSSSRAVSTRSGNRIPLSLRAHARRHPAPRGRARGALARVPGDGEGGRGGRVRVDLGRRPPALRRSGTGAVGGVDAAERARGGDRAGAARAARGLRRASTRRRCWRRWRRRSTRSAAGASCSGSARAGTGASSTRSASRTTSACQPLRGGVRDHPRPAGAASA